MDNMVETQGLTKRYRNGVTAVRGLDMTVRRGEAYGFLGPNGAGKTTTLRMLLGLTAPTTGTALVAGVAPGSRHSLASLGAMVEGPAFWPYLSGRDNLRVLARYCRVSDARVDLVLDEVGMTDRASRSFDSYSTGMKQRLGVAAALLKDPQLLVLDEPTNGLDPQGMTEFRGLIKRLTEASRTILLSSHLLAEVEHTCSRVGVIREGRLVAEGTIAQIRGAARVLVRATPAERARAVLVEALGADRVTAVADGSLALALGPAEIAHVSRLLVQAGLGVTEIREAERPLEDVFMELTGTESGG